jgi:DNA-binding LacI/PurR family transcriptional regulator
MNKKPTIKTIAGLAGVSHVTVSRALRGYPDISKATTKKIQQIAKDIGYTPNAFARSLSSKQSHTIGMIVPAMGNDTAYHDIFNSISSSAAAKGLSVLLGSCGRDLELEKSFCRNMCENRVGTLIIAPIGSEISHIKEICKDMVPVIFLGGKVGLEEENCITIDYRQSAKAAVEHLYQLGHRKIALFVYQPNNRTILQKCEGYEKTMREHGLTPRIYWEGDSSDTLKAGSILAERLIAENNLPTAIWCASDLMAIGVMDTLKRHNLNIPRDVSIIGHDNLFLSDLDFISLTTFSLPKKEIGTRAVDMALSIMKYDESSEETKPDCKATFNAELIVRHSTGINT